MKFEEIPGVTPEHAEKLRGSGYASVRDLQVASEERLASTVGEEAAKRIKAKLGTMQVDEKGRTTYHRTLNIAKDEDLDIVKVDERGAEAAHAAEKDEKRRVKFRIARGANGGHTFQEYDLEVAGTWTVLDALHHIKNRVDPTLTFRRSCGQAICGICAVRVNRVPRLVCNTPVLHILPAGMDTLTLEPLGNLPTLRDLVCDMRPFWEEVRRVKPWLDRGDDKLDPDHESRMLPGDLPDVVQMANCINCAVCFSDCDARRSAGNEFLGPMAAAKLYRFLADPRDRAYEERLKTAEKRGLWKCMYAYQCAWCPKGVEPQEAIVMVRRLIEDRHGYKGWGAKHTKEFEISVGFEGRLNEVRLPVTTKGPLGALADLPDAGRWLLRGKRPSIHLLSHLAERSHLVRVLKRRHPPAYVQRTAEEKISHAGTKDTHKPNPESPGRKRGGPA